MANRTTRFTTTHQHGGSTISVALEWLPVEELYVVLSRIDGELLAYGQRDGSVSEIVNALIAEGIEAINRRNEIECPRAI